MPHPAPLAEALELIDVALGAPRLPAAVREALDEAAARLDDADLVLRSDVLVEDPDGALTAALAAAQAAFPAIAKSHTATVNPRDKPSYSYSYADLSDVLGAVRPVLGANGLAIVQTTHHDGPVVILTTTLRHVAGGRIESTVELGQQPNNPQAFGGALTYLRRYELGALLGIAPEEDTDAQHVEPNGRGRGAAPAAAPPWALEATRERKAEALDALEPLIGRDRAKTLLASAAQTWGHVPDVVVGFVKGLAGVYAVAHGAEQARTEQDAAAEAGDPPAPEDTPAPDGGELLEDALRDIAPDDPPADADPDAPVPGSVEVNLIGVDTEADAIARLREAGCTCPHPLREPYADACPISGHGIPF